MGVSINTVHSEALMYFLRMILPPRNNMRTIPVSLASERITVPIRASGGPGIGRDLNSKGVVQELNPSGRQFQPQGQYSSFIKASSSQLPKAQTIEGREGGSVFGSPFSKNFS